MKSHVLSLRLKQEQMERLQRLARRADRKPSEMAARLIEEALRMAEFPEIEFRDSVLGRQAYLRGHRLTIWMLAWIARQYDYDPVRTAEHLDWPVHIVESGLRYYRAFADELDPVLAEHESSDLETLRRVLPDIKVFTVGPNDEASMPAAIGTPPVEAVEHVETVTR